MTGRRYGTPAARASHSMRGVAYPPPTPPTQQELRRRRRDGLPPGHYGGDWSLVTEITEQCEPLAARISTRPSPGRFAVARPGSVPVLAEATHELVGTAVGWLAEVDARARTAHLADDPGKRRYAVKTLVDLAQRPPLPGIPDAAVEDGSWPDLLVSMTDGIDAEFSRLLAHAFPPGAAALRGQQSRSEHLAALLSRTLDSAAGALERRLTRDERGANDRPHPAPDPSDAADELRKLGVPLT